MTFWSPPVLGELLLTLTLTVHLLSVNLAAAGPLGVWWCEWSSARGNRVAGEVGRLLAWWVVGALLLGGAVGLVLGFLAWESWLSAAVARLPRKVLYGVIQYFFSLALLIVHLVWWRRDRGNSRRARWGRYALLFLASTNLLYHFPPLFLVMTRLAEGDGLPTVVDAAAFRGLWLRGDILARTVHFVLASIAVTGVVLLLLAERSARRHGGAAGHGRVSRSGAAAAAVATGLQFPAGLWLVTRLPGSSQAALIGGDPVVTSLMVAGLALSFLLLWQLTGMAFGGKSRGRTVAVTLVGTVLIMTSVARQVRTDGLVDPPPDRFPQQANLLP